jgi:hypothetical protein
VIRAFAIWGANSQSWISYNGKVLVHGNRAELEYIFPGQTVRPIELREEEAMSIKKHPQMSNVQWPLRREDFL